MSLLRKLIPRVFVDSSVISAVSLLDGKVCVVFLPRMSLHSRAFSLLETLLTQACMEVSSGEEIDVSPLPSSERNENPILTKHIQNSSTAMILPCSV